MHGLLLTLILVVVVALIFDYINGFHDTANAIATAMAAGTAAGGVRIIKTMGTKIIDLKPIHGFAAETSAAITILTGSFLGMPVSMTHVITGCIMGAGASQRVSAVRWGVTTRIFYAWVLTIPVSAVVSWLCYKGLRTPLGE